MTFVDISPVCVDFCTKFYTIVKRTLYHWVLFNYFWKWTKLYYWNQDIPPFLSVRASCRTGWKKTVPSVLKLSRFESTGLAHLDYHDWGCHTGKVPSSSQGIRLLMSWKPPSRPSGTLPQEHMAVANFIKRLPACTWLRLPVVGDHFDHPQ